jgi:hypothetical protein
MDQQMCQDEQRMWNKPKMYKIYGIITVENTLNIFYTSYILYM